MAVRREKNGEDEEEMGEGLWWWYGKEKGKGVSIPKRRFEALVECGEMIALQMRWELRMGMGIEVRVVDCIFLFFFWGEGFLLLDCWSEV